MSTRKEGTLIIFYRLPSTKKLKNFKKLSKKVLTREKWCDIIVKLSRRAAAKRSLKIEQQERSTKHSMCERTDLVNQELIYTQQSKRS